MQYAMDVCAAYRAGMWLQHTTAHSEPNLHCALRQLDVSVFDQHA